MKIDSKATSLRRLIALSSLLLLCAGCTARKADVGQMVELLMPQEVRIVEAFTGFKSFDDDEIPDGIEVLLQPVDSFGDPVKIAGSVRVELFTFNKAAGNREGRRICQPWDVPLETREDQIRYWNKVTGMYEIQLEFPAGVTAQGDKYELLVTYNTPLDTRMTDECTIALPLALRS